MVLIYLKKNFCLRELKKSLFGKIYNFGSEL